MKLTDRLWEAVSSLVPGECVGAVPVMLNEDLHGFKIQAGLPAKTLAVCLEVQHLFPEVKGIGCWGDAAHAATKSCHNPVKDKTGHIVIGPRAADCMTADAAVHAKIVRWALDNRARLGITLIISRRQKWSKATGWLPKRYLGVSGHYDHVHLSVDC